MRSAMKGLMIVLSVLLLSCVSTSQKEIQKNSIQKNTQNSDDNIFLNPKKQDDMRIHYMNVGQGSCIFIQCPGAKSRPIIYDCGSSKHNGAWEFKEVEDYYDKIFSDEYPPNVVLSHPDKDHYNYLPKLITSAHNAIAGGRRSQWEKLGFFVKDHDGDEVFYEGREGTVQGDDFEVGYATWDNQTPKKLETHFFACGDATNTVLTVNAPSSSKSKKVDKNKDSLVLMTAYKDHRFIFTGDATKDTQNSVLDKFEYEMGKIEKSYLTMSHHGSNSHGSNSEIWIRDMRPYGVIATAGVHSTHLHPRCDVLDRYLDFGNDLLAAPQHDVTCGEKGDFVEVPVDKRIWNTFTSKTIVFTVKKNGTLNIWSVKPNGDYIDLMK